MQRKRATLSISGATITIALSISASIAVHSPDANETIAAAQRQPSVRVAARDAADSTGAVGVELLLDGVGRTSRLRACVTLAGDSSTSARRQVSPRDASRARR